MQHKFFLIISFLSICTFSQAAHLNEKIRTALPASLQDNSHFSDDSLNLLDGGKKGLLLGLITARKPTATILSKLEEYVDRSKGRKAR